MTYEAMLRELRRHEVIHVEAQAKVIGLLKKCGRCRTGIAYNAALHERDKAKGNVGLWQLRMDFWLKVKLDAANLAPVHDELPVTKPQWNGYSPRLVTINGH